MKLPVIDRYDDAHLIRLGYVPFRVSLFDHWLTAIEASDCDFISYNIATERGKIMDYLEGEKKFTKFYRELYSGVTVFKISKTGNLIVYDSSNLDRIIQNSLREFNLMDIYVENLDIRVIGGYDRTDLLLART